MEVVLRKVKSYTIRRNEQDRRTYVNNIYCKIVDVLFCKSCTFEILENQSRCAFTHKLNMRLSKSHYIAFI